MSSSIPDASSPPAYDYIVYIDEAGDTGLKRVQPRDPDGASEWMCMGALIIKANFEPHLVPWVSRMRENLQIRNRPDIHFRELRNERNKIRACEMLATFPATGFVVCSNKQNMRQYRNEAAEAKYPTKQWFYNFCIRVLLERVSHYIASIAMDQFGEKRFARIIFSERGGHSYRHTETYTELLTIQGKSNNLILSKRAIDWDVIHWKLLEAQSHKTAAGCQLADILTSAFYAAAHSRQKKWTTKYAEALSPIMATEPINGDPFHADYGITLLPWHDRDREVLTEEQRKIFRYYGYCL